MVPDPVVSGPELAQAFDKLHLPLARLRSLPDKPEAVVPYLLRQFGVSNPRRRAVVAAFPLYIGNDVASS